MTSRFDAAWLKDIQQRLERGEKWEEEVQTFLRGVRDLARTVIARTSRRALSAGHDEDIVALANARFVGSGIRRYRGEASPQSYYATIVARATVSYLRPRYRSEQSVDPAAINDSVGIDSDADRVELRHDLAVALLKLYQVNPLHAEAFELYYLQELGSDAECGEVVGVDAEAFRKRRERARAFLRELLGPPSSKT